MNVNQLSRIEDALDILFEETDIPQAEIVDLLTGSVFSEEEAEKIKQYLGKDGGS